MQYNINHVYCSLRDSINLIFYSCATNRYCLESNTEFLAVNQELVWKLHLHLPGPEKMGRPGLAVLEELLCQSQGCWASMWGQAAPQRGQPLLWVQWDWPSPALRRERLSIDHEHPQSPAHTSHGQDMCVFTWVCSLLHM